MSASLAQLWITPLYGRVQLRLPLVGYEQDVGKKVIYISVLCGARQDGTISARLASRAEDLDPILLNRSLAPESRMDDQEMSGSILMQKIWGHARTLFHVQYDVTRIAQGT